MVSSRLPTAALAAARPSAKLSSRPERPDFFFRAEVWRVGPRSGGIAAPLPRHPAHCALPPFRSPVIPNGVCAVRYGFPSHPFCAMNPSASSTP